ncbi:MULTISPECIES: response regulator transcription factor [unclassified Sphingobacterium]|uniref:response regulator n=1 Tax=unclassified Sphingobacterium TaxID=2609468 RepID=UPI0020C1C9D2|nr:MULTISPECIES: response regulator transcription factor [unclassified Sphingobacterium]
MENIKLAIIDDHKVVLDGLISMLSSEQRIQVVLVVQTADELNNKLQESSPDILLMDIQMPGISGIDLAYSVLKTYPELRIIAFSSFDESHYIKQILRNGAKGYLLKNADRQTIIEAIFQVAEGENYIDERLKSSLLQESIFGHKRSMHDIPLTNRETEILRLIAEEFTNQEIAEKLFIGLRTVETHRLNLNQKLGVKTSAGLVKQAIKRGLIN